MNSSFIDQELFRCRQFSGSYPVFPNMPFKTEDLIKSIYHIVKGRSSNLEIKTSTYADVNGTKSIIYIGVCLPVLYKGNNYSVYSKITFPPNFPLVPPIFAILNINENQFEVNKKYFYFMLPDKTYEVKLLSSKYWKQSFNFNGMLDEFCQTLGTNFPFFKISNPTKNINVPVIYDPRYNLPNVDFPFDYEMVDNNRAPDRGYTPTPDNKPTNQFFNNNNQNQYNNMQSFENKKTTAVRETLENIKNIMDIDLKTYEQNLVTLVGRKEQLDMKERVARECEAKLQKNIKIVSDDLQRLNAEHDKQKAKELNEKTLHDIIVLDVNDKKILKAHSEIKGNTDAQQVVEDLFLEKEIGEFKDVLKSLNVLWKREFDARIGYNYCSGELA